MLDALGEAVDRDLVAQDVRLTTGGEPTFVSIDDYQSAEWRTAAHGPMKRGRADDLVRRLCARFASGGLLHHGQGKWYPGEPQPRWAFSLYWRQGGAPLWTNPALIAPEAEAAVPQHDAARQIAAAIATKLGFAADCVLAAFEDPAPVLLKEAAYPVDIDPLDPALGERAGRAELVRAFERGLGTPAGFVLPLRPVTCGGWITERWIWRRGRLVLPPGGWPIGYRLPLDSLPAASEDVDTSVRTALAVEPRDGMVCVFMPPMERLQDYVALLNVVEAAAAELRTPIRIEGYPPPADPHLNLISVTPDPGVIHVNVHPAASWR